MPIDKAYVNLKVKKRVIMRICHSVVELCVRELL